MKRIEVPEDVPVAVWRKNTKEDDDKTQKHNEEQAQRKDTLKLSAPTY